MDKKRSISIKEIAKLANVSVATVSRVINNNGRFSEETRKKVQDIIDKYGYTTNMAAKSLRMSKSKTVGLIVPNIDNEWFSHLVLEIEKYFFEKNYSVFICNTSQDEQKEIAYFKSLDSKLVDGIMCISGIEEIPTDVITRNIPIVCIDRKPKDHNNVYKRNLKKNSRIMRGLSRIVRLSQYTTETPLAVYWDSRHFTDW